MQRQNVLLEKKFSDKERLLSGIIDFLPDATFVIDSDGKVIAWNRAIETMTGVKKEDILGKGNYEYALPFYKKRRPMLLDLALAPSPEEELAYGQIRKDKDKMAAENYYPGFRGDNAWLGVNASVLRGARGEIIGAIESIRDVTDCKTSEERLVASNQELEQFAYAASHDLQEPLRSVVSFLRLLQSRYGDQLDEKGRFYIERSVKAGKRMQALISDLSSLSPGRARAAAPFTARTSTWSFETPWKIFGRWFSKRMPSSISTDCRSVPSMRTRSRACFKT